MTHTHRVVLYNPRAPFFTMPLALVAHRVGARSIALRRDASSTDDSKPIRSPASLEATDGALCLGVSVLTGAPIRDALRVTRRRARERTRAAGSCGAAGTRRCFPHETLREAGVDAVVVGQGEDSVRGDRRPRAPRRIAGRRAGRSLNGG